MAHLPAVLPKNPQVKGPGAEKNPACGWHTLGNLKRTLVPERITVATKKINHRTYAQLCTSC